MNKFEVKANTLEALGAAYKFLENQRDYCCDRKTDEETGEYMYDENGKEILVPPSESSYNYGNYVGYCEALKILDNLKF